jgi:hypothetical protein
MLADKQRAATKARDKSDAPPSTPHTDAAHEPVPDDGPTPMPFAWAIRLSVVIWGVIAVAVYFAWR